MIMVRNVLPNMTNVLQNRQDKISNNLESADNLKDEATQMEEEYRSFMEKTRGKSGEITAAANAEMNKISENKHKELDGVLFKKGLEAEERIAKARKKVIGEISSVSSELSVAIVKKLADLKISNKKAQEAVKNLLK